MSSEPTPILLIDDNPDDMLLTCDLLKKARLKHSVITAADGEEGINRLRHYAAGGTAQLPAFVLCDVRMPKLDGFDVLKWIRNQPRLSGLYVAMHTGGDVPKDRARARSLGADQFLMKFPTLEELRKIAREASARATETEPARTTQR